MVRVRGDRDHPLSHGYTCPKGRALPQMHHHPERFEHPLIRTDGGLQPTTWDACLDDLCVKLRDIIDRHGPEAVGILFGTGVGMDAAGYRMAQGLHAAIGTPAKFSPLTIDGTAKVLISELMGGSSALTGRPDYDGATLVMLIGSNPVVSHGHTVGMPNPTGAIRDLAKRAQVWVVDPRHTETARLATRHLAPRPGTDYAVLAFLVREVLRSGVEVLVQGVDELAAAVEPFTLAHAAEVADVSQAELSELLAAVRRAGRIAIDTGTGVTMSASANVTQWLSWALLILTDSMNRPGGYWFHPGFAYQLEAFELPISPPEGTFGPGPRSRPETQAFLREWPCAVLPDEIMAGNIRAFLNLGGSLVTAFPDAGSLVPALKQLDVFATTEILPNETTALSTHVLPTKDQLERPDVTLWDILSPRVCAQHTSAVVDAVGERRSMWWVLAEIGRRLGHQLADTSLSDDAMLASLSGGGRCTFEELAEAGYVEAPRELPAAVGGAARRAPRRLAAGAAVAGRSVGGVAGACPAGAGAAPAEAAAELAAGVSGRERRGLLHPDDAAAAGVVDGRPVIVRSEHGELTGIAKVDPSIRRGAVSVPHGHAEANVNLLTSKDDIDLVTGMTRYSGVPVTLHPGVER